MTGYAQGESLAFELLYERFGPRLKRYLAARLGTAHASTQSDLFQIIWLKIHQARKTFKTSGRFAPWFFTIARNQIRDFYREKSAHLEDASENLDEVASPSLQLTDHLSDLQLHLQALAPDQRDLLLLSDLEGFSPDELAPVFQKSPEALRKSLSRVRQKIRTLSHQGDQT